MPILRRQWNALPSVPQRIWKPWRSWKGFAGQIIWQGEVEIFTLDGHAKAKRAYGWQTGDGTDAQFTAVLEIPPVDFPNAAVRAAIAAKARS